MYVSHNFHNTMAVLHDNHINKITLPKRIYIRHNVPDTPFKPSSVA